MKCMNFISIINYEILKININGYRGYRSFGSEIITTLLKSKLKEIRIFIEMKRSKKICVFCIKIAN